MNNIWSYCVDTCQQVVLAFIITSCIEMIKLWRRQVGTPTTIDMGRFQGVHAKDNYTSGRHRIAPCSLYRNSCHVCIGMIWQSPLHTRRHMGGNSTDPRIWRQGPHSSPGPLQAPYKCIQTYPIKVWIKHSRFVCCQQCNLGPKCITSIAYSKLSVSIFSRRYLHLPLLNRRRWSLYERCAVVDNGMVITVFNFRSCEDEWLAV